MQSRFSREFFFSFILHVVVLLLLIISLEMSGQILVVENSDKNTKIISAVAMETPTPASASIPVSTPASLPPAPPSVAKVEPPKPVAIEPLQPKPSEIAQKAIALNDTKKKQKAEEKAAIEKQLLADLKKQTVKIKQLKQKDLEQAMAKELQDQATKALQKQLLQAQQRANGAKTQGMVNKYKALILQAIGERLLVPPGMNKTLHTDLMIRLAPGGTVLDVQITRGSGMAAFDSSARNAVFKASPLPVPDETAAFEEFRQFALKVKPEFLINSDG